MSYTSKVKEEIFENKKELIEKKYLLKSFIKYAGRYQDCALTFTFENPTIARYIYNLTREIYSVKPGILIRIQKRFKTKQIYTLSIKSNLDEIFESCNMIIKNGKIHNDLVDLKTPEEIKSYLKGTFIACGSLTDPKNSYHLELVFTSKKSADFISNLFHEFDIKSKVIKRTSKYMVYIKSSEEISDILKIFETNSALFYFEEVRTEKDHINMVNRLNNCEQANQDKTIKTGINQINDINYLKENDLLTLLDEKTQLIISYREKYPELSYQELSEVVSLESGYRISKSGINHHFIKMRELVEKHKKKSTV